MTWDLDDNSMWNFDRGHYSTGNIDPGSQEGDFIMFDEIPISTIKLPEGRFQTSPDISLSEELR